MPRTIQLQHADGTVYRHIGPSELRDMENRNEVEVIIRRKSGNIMTIARLKPHIESKRSMKEASKPCITYADVLANVGLADRPNSTMELSRGRMLAAQAKIAAFGEGRLVCVHHATPEPGFDVNTVVILNVEGEVLGFDDTSELAELPA